MEWTDFRFYGLRQATAYILVFDLSKNHIDSTFQYIKSLRDQILESRAKDIEKVTLMVVGNKLDLMPNLDRLHVAPKQSHSLLDTVAQTLNGSHHRPLTPYETARKNIITLVRKHWRCPYVECSAKYNYKLNHAFKELMDTIEANYRRAQMSREKQARPRRHGLLTAFQHRMNRSNEEENVEEGEGSSRNCRIL
ncbi:hypothetical protein M8J76_012473 [Diaphorina citri]|nr:hypothetical protein M8J76_012473 [Diaphorina citri]KAI5725202.1 hypothetical protein M8J77_012416 [Diaphorina citri]